MSEEYSGMLTQLNNGLNIVHDDKLVGCMLDVYLMEGCPECCCWFYLTLLCWNFIYSIQDTCTKTVVSSMSSCKLIILTKLGPA